MLADVDWPEDPLPLPSSGYIDGRVLPPAPARAMPSPRDVDPARIRAMNELVWLLSSKACACRFGGGVCPPCRAKRITRRWPLHRRKAR